MTLEFTLRSGDAEGVAPDEVRVTVDGTDVTNDCFVRVPALHPASRADFSYAPRDGWATGDHQVMVEWAERMPPARWSFDVD